MLTVKNLTKRFEKVTALDNISFDVKSGEIFGLLGENGAGKTTTLRILATMLKATEGSVEICGLDLNKKPEEVRALIGILFGGESGLYDRLSVEENITYFGELNGMDKSTVKKRIEELAEVFTMQDFLGKRASKLSKGMKQKAAFARAIIHNPEVMLFDEPISGLDVSTIRDVHEFILKCKNEGKTIILSSHTMSEVEKLCDRVGVIHKGKLLDVGTIEEFKSKYESNSLEEIFIRLVGGKNEF
jgi:sodium transport system ATP-binding protein